MRLPSPRGELSAFLVEHLAGGAPGPLPTAPALPPDPRFGEDFHVSLHLCYELHYAGYEEVDDAWEWEPTLLAIRGGLERAFEAALVRDAWPKGELSPDEVEDGLRALGAPENGPTLAGHVARLATLEQVRELVVQRSGYQLKEADPHSWTIPRLRGAPKTALVEVQFDEYGAGDPSRLHQTLYHDTMAALGLDPANGAYVDRLPGVTLATSSLSSLFGLHRRLRGASMGHLALFEMTSPDANRRYGNGLRRLGLGSEVTGFYDEHVEADALHDAIAVNDVAGAIARSEPALAPQVLFGARALLAVEERFSERVLGAWAAGETSLLAPLPAPAAVA